MNRRTTFLLFSSIILVTALAHGPALAQLARNDRAFLKEATGLARFQGEASKLATSHADNINVKAYAQAVLKRHSAGNLAPLARSRGVTAPLMEGAHRKTLNELSRAKGTAFDNLYILKVALGAQREELAMLERSEPTLQDAGIRAWAQDMLPRLREQIAQAPRTAGRGPAPAAKRLAKTSGNASLLVAP